MTAVASSRLQAKISAQGLGKARAPIQYTGDNGSKLAGVGARTDRR